MKVQHHYVRRKSDPTLVLMSGYSDFTGQFDPLKYEIIKDDLPQEAKREIQLTVEEHLKRLIKTVSVAERMKFYRHKAALDSALANQDKEAAVAILTNLTGLSSGLDLLRTKMLEKLGA